MTDRQLRYWASQGYLSAEITHYLLPGSGHVRQWTATEQRILAVIGQLRLAGIDAELACKVAARARMQAHGVLTVPIAACGAIAILVNLDTLPS